MALEDTREFGQRVKLDDYAHTALLVFFGVEPRERGRPRLVEVHRADQRRPSDAVS